MKDIVHCRCGCKYNPETQFVIGYYNEGTTSKTINDFIITGSVPKGACPVCRSIPKEKE